MASSCSSLKQLSLSCSPGLQLTALLQLTGLSELWLTGIVSSSTITSLAQLSGLQGLQTLVIASYKGVGDSEVFELTKLTQLTHLALPHQSAFSPALQQQLQLFYHGALISYGNSSLCGSDYAIRSKVSQNQ